MKKSKLFKQFFALRIHGSNLLSPGAEQWMFIARILVFLIATVEAMSWGYMGGLLGSGNSKYVMGLLTGTIIFLVVWMVDITLMSLDRHKRYYYKKIYELGKKDDEAKDDFLFKLLNLIKENGVQIGIGFRIGMVAISMIVTAPFLNQLVFQNDINKAINREKEKIIANKRDNIGNLRVGC